MSCLAVLPFGYYATRRRDNRAVSRIVRLMGLDLKTALGLELEAVLRDRVSDCRDLFTLRGVRPPSGTVLRLAARMIRADQIVSWASEILTPARAAALLRAAATLMDRMGRVGYAACARDPAARRALAAAPDQAATASSLVAAAAARNVATLHAVHGDRSLNRPLPPVRHTRGVTVEISSDDWSEDQVRLAA